VGDAHLLKQNTGNQAAVISRLLPFHRRHEGSLAGLQRDAKGWRSALRKVRDKVVDMPLWRLQRVGEVVDDFLYEQTESPDEIVLRRGVAFCLRRFYGLLRDMIEARWIDYLRRANRAVIGETSELRGFLFGSTRANLDVLKDPLMEEQQGRCFYCQRRLREEVHVDHFIPWSRYAADLGHNYVLAHARCNEHKSASLAAEDHLRHWQRRNATSGDFLEKELRGRNVVFDLDSTLGIARWAYTQVAAAQGLVWTLGKQLVPLTGEWEKILGVGA
jgi:hypothetical protein